LDARGAQTGEAVLVDGILPGQEFFHRQRVAAAGFLERSRPPRTAATTSALRRMTQRLVPGAGRSAIVSGLPSGPMTYLALGRRGSFMNQLTHSTDQLSPQTTRCRLKFA